MNGDPYRTPQPTDRRVINRAGQAPQRVEEQPQSARAAAESVAQAAPRPTSSSHRNSHAAPAGEKKKSKGVFIWGIGTGILIAILLALSWTALFGGGKGAIAGIDSGKYQTVYLMNGQIYFGKLTAINNNQLKLTDVYYLQTPTATATEDGDSNSSDASKAQLIKLSNAIYDPSNEMIISRDQLLYFQNLRTDSRASKLIQEDK